MQGLTSRERRGPESGWWGTICPGVRGLSAVALWRPS